MKSITRQKSFEEIAQELNGYSRAYIVGCGTCATMTRTGGRDEVMAMRDQLQGLGKTVTGWTVIPMPCDEMTEATIEQSEGAIRNANCVLVMACALGVQRVGLYAGKPVVPALDTLFIGFESSPSTFNDVCDQCGHCVLGATAGICPITQCTKGLLNGPCAGAKNGKCEASKDMDCAWVLIYKRLEALGEIEKMRRYAPPRNYGVLPRPHRVVVPASAS